MDEKTRGSGGVLVRVNPLALSGKYSDLSSEDDVQGTLAAELESCGWSVTREAACRPASGKVRRIDLYCVAPPWFGRTHSGIARNQPERRVNIRPGFILGIECKHQQGTSKDIDAYIQCRRYASASVWSDPEGRPLAKPDWFATCSTTNLSGRGWCGRRVDWTVPNDHVRRIMWRDGCDVLHRLRDGSLYVSVRVPAVVENRGKVIITTKDHRVPVTLWTNRPRDYWTGGLPGGAP